MSRDPPDLELVPGISVVCGDNAINMAIRYRPFYLNYGDHPVVPLVFMHGRGPQNFHRFVH